MNANESKHLIRCLLCYEEPNAAINKLRDVFQRARQDSEWTILNQYARSKEERMSSSILTRLHSKVVAERPCFPALREVVSLVHFHRHEVGELSDSQVQSTEALQNGILSDISQAALAVATLEGLGEELTTVRGLSFDITAIRLRLHNAGIRLRDIPELGPDLRELDAESGRTLTAFHHHHRLQLGKRFTLDRPILHEVVSLAANGSLLIVGEPGTGKTGVLMSLARQLKESGRRVWFLSIDRYSGESLPCLEKELNLKHRLTDLFGFASEGVRSVLLLDGLDAARDRAKQATWRDLVAEAQSRGIPVIATIRLFDIRHSKSWQELFKRPTAEGASLDEVELKNVRFLKVDELSDVELDKALLEFPKVGRLSETQSAIRDLARNLFNLNLLCDLAKEGMPHNPVRTQLDLLDAWWEKRASETIGEEIEGTLSKLVERMVSARALQAGTNGLEPYSVFRAQSVGLIRAIPARPGYLPDESVEFAHNLLFDYAGYRCFLKPKRDELISLLSMAESWGLFLRPSLAHFYTWLWDKARGDFWERAFELQSSSVPIVHKSVMWFTIARSASRRDDFDPLLNGMEEFGAAKEKWLSLARGVNGSGEAAAWKQLFRRSDGLWWVEYARDLLRSSDLYVTNLGWQILYVLYYEIEHVRPEAFPLVNRAACLEVERHWTSAVPFGPGIKPCIWLLCRTMAGNPEVSALLIRRMLTPEELALSGYFRGNEVAREIVAVARCMPDLAVEVYQRLFSHHELSAEQVPMGGSQVLSLTTNRHDMFSSAYYELTRALPEIFGVSPRTATRAVCRVLGDEKGGRMGISGSNVRFRFNNTDITTSGLGIVHSDLDMCERR